MRALLNYYFVADTQKTSSLLEEVSGIMEGYIHSLLNSDILLLER